MIGLLSAGVGLPAGRYDSGFGPRAVAALDEDAVTLAVEAGRSALRDASLVDVGALYLATNSPPFAEGSSASLVARILGLPGATRAVDVTGSLKTGTTALALALDSVESGAVKLALVIAVDVRRHQDATSAASLGGDGAAAFLVGDGDAAASVSGRISVTGEGVGPRRLAGEARLRSGSDQNFATLGYMPSVASALKLVFTKYSLQARSFSRVLLDSPDGLSHEQIAEEFGFDLERQLLRDVLLSVGHTGAAHPLLLLASSLEMASPGDRVLLISWGDGADALVLDVGHGVEVLKSHAPFGKALKGAAKLSEEEFRTLLTRPALDAQTAPTEPQEVTFGRLEGSSCSNCGAVYAVPLRVCPSCQEKDSFERIPLGRAGIIYTYTVEYGGLGEPPVALAVVNLLGGGRILLQITDTPLAELAVGKEVVLVLRKIYDTADGPSYYFKGRVVEDGS